MDENMAHSLPPSIKLQRKKLAEDIREKKNKELLNNGVTKSNARRHLDMSEPSKNKNDL